VLAEAQPETVLAIGAAQSGGGGESMSKTPEGGIGKSETACRSCFAGAAHR
jgi:hypothetical protein